MNDDTRSSANRNPELTAGPRGAEQRAARIERVRRQIADGSYETDTKLDVILRKLLQDLHLDRPNPVRARPPSYSVRAIPRPTPSGHVTVRERAGSDTFATSFRAANQATV